MFMFHLKNLARKGDGLTTKYAIIKNKKVSRLQIQLWPAPYQVSHDQEYLE